ncbi:tyrosine-type recombinase/integrase [Paenibacillus validus]|uniref:tyrosine-type recombinase/integrase n=1 Tax=Paenibacillus validus TaxID=44253 RepID=UPI003D2D9AD7
MNISMDDYKLWLREEGKRPNTVNRYLRIAADFQEWHKAAAGREAFEPQLVSALDLQDWKTYLLDEATYQRTKEGDEQKYSITSVNNSVKGIKVYFDFLKEAGAIPANPADKLKPQKIQEDEDEPRWLERAERSRFLFYIDNAELRKKNAWRFTRNRAISFVMMHAGLRVSEVVDLEPADLDFQDEILRVRNGKGGKSRIVEMNKDLIDALQEWTRERGQPKTKKLFVSQRGGALTTDGVEHIFKQLRDKTGIADLTPHVLRHTFAHDLAERGESLRTIAKLLGHSNINYTRKYVTPSRKERKAAVNKLAGERYS